MATPSYSLLLGLMGCCLGRPIEPEEVKLGFQYSFDDTAEDVETRQRLVNDSGKIKSHAKGTDAHTREFHINPHLILWLDRLDWEVFFRHPIGAPSLGRSQDLLKIKSVQQVAVEPVPSAKVSGCLLPFNPQLKIAGQLIQLAEAYLENSIVGSGRTAINSRIFIAIPFMKENEEHEAQLISFPNLYQTSEKVGFYMHDWIH